jgi:MinD-like ATPase involved in chromosome partitioning or flagellar assembly
MKPGIIVNMIRNKKERNVAKVIHDVSEKYLDISPEYLGFVDYDPLLEKSINKMEAFFMAGKSDSTNMQVYDIAMKILKRTPKETLKIHPSNPIQREGGIALLNTQQAVHA